MKFTTSILLGFLLCLPHSMSFAQQSPIHWLNKTFTINIDTIANKERDYKYGGFLDYRSGSLKYKFVNTGTHVTFIDDTTGRRDIMNVTKPKDSSTVYLEIIKFDFDHAYQKKQNTTKTRLLFFYYEGEIFPEKVTCQLTFGKSKLIKYDSFRYDATEKVTQLINSSTKKDPIVNFKHYFTIKNISKKPIYCTQSLTAWNDVPGTMYNYGKLEVIKPGRSYNIPIEMNVYMRYMFRYTGQIIVFNDEMSEAFNCEVSSDYKRK